MHVEIYVEEPSAKVALDILVPRIIGAEHTFFVHGFRDKQTLLKEIPKRLKGYARWIPTDWRFAVLVDEDRQDCHRDALAGHRRQSGTPARSSSSPESSREHETR